ncbi:hypothetical protein BC936DRAFT_147087 [Jimgerdemannia flammicorona]|uniref:F-box domain-containing protein n=1 Tax=Jimgerdemannia flammicorona TaxID=994334 RepID=A0A433D678_9FUNG|nr:hypothetical protein BC936DRAFT_147087 [Jimgerdemannia flammicorona]
MGQSALIRAHAISLRTVQVSRGDADTLAALETCRGLRVLRHKNNWIEWGTDVEALGKFCRSRAVEGLEALCVKNWGQFQGSHLSMVAERAGVRLTRVVIRGSFKVTEAFEALAMHCQYLEELDTDSIEQKAFEHPPTTTLRSLTLYKFDVDSTLRAAPAHHAPEAGRVRTGKRMATRGRQSRHG